MLNLEKNYDPQYVDNKINKEYCNLLNETFNSLKKKFRPLEISLKKNIKQSITITVLINFIITKFCKFIYKPIQRTGLHG